MSNHGGLETNGRAINVTTRKSETNTWFEHPEMGISGQEIKYVSFDLDSKSRYWGHFLKF
jgi:hypothetical protein